MTDPPRTSPDEASAAIWTDILRVAKHLGKRELPPIEPRPPVVQLKNGKAEPPLYFIGGGLSEFNLAQLMGSERSIFAVEVPWPSTWSLAAAKNDTSALPTMEQLVALYVGALSVHAHSAPCVLAGISFLGLMAFEAAHQLNKQRGNVEMVLLLDAPAKYPAPHQVAWQKLQIDWNPKRNQRSTDRASQTIASRLASSWSIIRWMLVKEIKQLARPFRRAISGDLGPLTPRLDDQGVPMHWALVERVYANALKTYHLRCLDCRGVLFRADPTEDRPARTVDGSMGWDTLFGKGLEIIQVPGDHLSMVQQKLNAAVLAQEMTTLLNRSYPQQKQISLDT